MNPEDTGSSHRKDRRLLFLFLGVIVLFLAFRVPFLNKEYAPEEAAWIRAGQGVAQTGFPWTYLGEQTPGAWAYWKGPLYPWLLGGGFKLFGEHEWVARGIPMLFALGQIILLWLISIRIWGKKLGAKIGFLAAAIIAINPFAIQNAVQVDIDGGLVGFFSLLILYAAWPIVTNGISRRNQWVFLGVASLLSFLTRFDTSLMIFFSVMVFQLIQGNKGVVCKALKLCGLFALAILAYFLLVGSYNAAFHQFPKTFEPFQNLTRQVEGAFGAKSATGAAPALLDATAPPPTRLSDVFQGRNFGKLTPLVAAAFPTAAFLTVSLAWLTIPFVFLLLFVLMQFLKRRAFSDKAIYYLGIPALITFLAFALVAPSFNYPRYIATAMLLFVLLMSYFLVTSWEKIQIGRKEAVALFLFAVAIILLVWWPKGAFLLLSDRVRSNPILVGELAVLTGIAGVALGLLVRQKKIVTAIATLSVIAYFIFSAFIVSADLGRPYSLNAYYGNYGFKAAGQYLKSVVTPSSTVIAVDTIGYYYGSAYYDINLCNANPLSCMTGKHGFIADYNLPPGRFDALVKGLPEIASFGTVSIYRFDD